MSSNVKVILLVFSLNKYEPKVNLYCLIFS